MYRKSIIVLALCLGMWATIGGESMAGCKLSSTGKLVCGSPMCADDLFLKGIGNPSINAVAVCMSVSADCSGECLNPADNSAQAQGVAFSPKIAFCSSDLVKTADLTSERGTAVIDDLCILNEENPGEDIQVYLITAVEAWVQDNIGAVCPNKKWTYVPGSTKFLKLYAYYSTYELTRQGVPYASNELCSECEVKTGGIIDEYVDCNCTCNLLMSADKCKERGLNEICAEAAYCQIFPGKCLQSY